MHDDLLPKLQCSKRGEKKVGLIYTPGMKEYRQDPYTDIAWGAVALVSVRILILVWM